jgi:hypothetical protein
MKPITGLTLSQDIAAGQTTIPVVGDLPAFNARFPYILIRDEDNGDEWVRFEEFDATNQEFILDPASDYGARGVRGTADVAHTAVGADGRRREVSFGYTVVGVFQNPRGREYWGHVGG